MTKQQGFESVHRFEKSDNRHKSAERPNSLHKLFKIRSALIRRSRRFSSAATRYADKAFGKRVFL
jgi:hypothetical protein